MIDNHRMAGLGTVFKSQLGPTVPMGREPGTLLRI